jgi:hypothetical protein
VAALQLQFLAEQINEQQILSALNLLPRGLDQTYDAALSRIKSQPPGHVELAIRALIWLTFAKEHLPATSLRHALAVKDDTTDLKAQDLPNLQMILFLCIGLVTLEQESGTVRLVHETTQRYLRSYFQKERDGHAEIAKVCLRYFSFPAFYREFENEQSFKEHMARYPLSDYASRYWFVHIRGGLEEKFVAIILKTFQSDSVLQSVEQISRNSKGGYFERGPRHWHWHLLHTASKYGLFALCREIVGPTSKIQNLYFPSGAQLILAKCPLESF